METLGMIFKISFLCAGVGAAALLNVFIWGSVVAIITRGKKNGNNKNIHKH